MAMTLVLDGDDRDSIDRRLGGGIAVDGFVLMALSAMGIDATTLRGAMLSHRPGARRDAAVALRLPAGYGLHGRMIGDRFETDRLELDDVVWYSHGSAGTPHVVIRRRHVRVATDGLVGRPLDVGDALPTSIVGPVVRSAVSSPDEWIYMDVDAIDSRI